jgi:hypothetical protein
MSAKQRDRAYRLTQQKKHRDKQREKGGPKEGRHDAYKRNKRNAERATLRQGDWGWL